MHRKVLVIGNGFDKAHNLPTAYDDFLKILQNPEGFYEAFNLAFSTYDETNLSNMVIDGHWCLYVANAPKADKDQINKMVNIMRSNSWAYYYANCNAEIDGWVDFENEMVPVLSFFNEIVTGDSQYVGNGYNGYTIVRLDRIGLIRIAELWPKYIKKSTIYGNENPKLNVSVEWKYSDMQYGILKKKLIEDLKSDLDEFIEAFQIYLTEIVSYRNIEICEIIKSMEGITDIINFNYTETARNYNNLKDSKMHFVHGSTNNKGEYKMIFGVNEIEDDAKYLFKDFEKRYQRLCNNLFPSYKKAIEGNDYELTIYGHSLDITDKSILKPLIEGAVSTDIYCHFEDGRSDIGKKVKNLMLIFGDEDADNMLYQRKIELIE